MSNANKLLLIDGNSIVNRAYFALPPLNDKEGRNVNAVYGFVNILVKVLADYAPDKLVVAFDKHGDNFRKHLYSEYKANRKGMPDDLAQQMPILHQLLQTMSVTIVEKAGVEADDIIGTISLAHDGQSFVVSGDKDMLQLVSDKVTVLLTKRGVTEVEVVNEQTLQANYNLTPSQVIDYKALRGDTSDNIPGVAGIGDKTAMSLLAQYGNLDGVYASVDGIKGALRDKLVNGKQMAYVSKQLATIVTNADVQFNLENAHLPVYDEQTRQTFEQLQFRSLLGRLNFEQSEQTPNKVQVAVNQVTTLEQLRQVVQTMQQSNLYAFVATKTQLLLANSDQVEYCIEPSDNFLDEITLSVAWTELQPLLTSDNAKVVYDGKATRHLLDNFGVQLGNVAWDVCLMQYLVEYRAHKDVQSLCNAYGYDNVCAGIFGVCNKLQQQLQNNAMNALYADVELPLSKLLYEMEVAGISVDEPLLDQLSADFHQKQQSLTQEIYDLAGEQFNVNSTQQLSRILFEKLQLPHGKKTKNGYSTNVDVLEEIQNLHPIVGKIMQYKKIAKLVSTYLDGIKPLVKRGIVHTTFNQTLTATGRLSSSDPNLQNVPVRNEQGKEIRKLFRSKNGIFVGADYSQIELRMLAGLSGDENLLQCFKEGQDIHTKVASELLGIAPQMVNEQMRRMAKAVNFGIIYGISDFGLACNANISVKTAHDYIEKYFARFPKIKTFLDGSVVQARETGYVTTITGRRRQIPEIKSSNHHLRGFGERAAMNMPLQGSAADVMKIAMLKVDQALKSNCLRSQIVLQIHDEIIVDCYLDEAPLVKQIVKEQMENAIQFACPLTVDMEEGATLFEA